MRLLKRSLIGLLFLLLIFVVHILLSTGFFRTIEPQFEGKIIKEIALKGAEDITISLEDSFAIVSATNRQVYPPQEEEKGALYFIDLKTNDLEPVLLSGDFNTPFAPHGISIYKKDSSHLVMAINHTDNGQSIEVFDLSGTQLTHVRTYTDPSMIRPNDLVIIDEDHFYFTNDHGYISGIMKLLEEYGGLRVSNVVYSNGKTFKEVADGIAYANGINYDADRNLLFVASPRDFMIKVYSKESDGSLTFIEDIPCGTGVDNIEFDEVGNLWIGSHPNLLHFSAYAKGKKETSPSEIIKITYNGKSDYTVEKVYVGDGKEMSASSVAAPYGDMIFFGNVMDEKFLILKSKNIQDYTGEVALNVKLQMLADTIKGNLGAHIYNIESRQYAYINKDKQYPMQSVYKFPITLLMLRMIEEGKFNLHDSIQISPAKYIPSAGHSPMRDQYPGGVTLTVKELIEYNVSQSDGTACDVLLELMGGTEQVQQKLKNLGIKDMKIATTEMVQVANDTIQYQNWSTPEAMSHLFLAFHNQEYLTQESTAFLAEYLSVSNKWFDKRLKGLLDKQTPLIHKTGSSRTYDGLTRATNDAGIINLPNGDHLIVSVFLSDAYHTQEERELIIAQVAKVAFDYWSH